MTQVGRWPRVEESDRIRTRSTTWPWAVLALFVSSLAMQPSEAQLAQCDSPSIGWPASQCTLPCPSPATEECTSDQIIPVSCPMPQIEQKQTMHGLEISRALSARLSQIGLSFCGFPVPYVRRVICITLSLSHALFSVFFSLFSSHSRSGIRRKSRYSTWWKRRQRNFLYRQA